MKSQITEINAHKIENGFNDVNWCFLINATPIDTGEKSELSDEDILTLFENGGDISTLTNSRNISPFRTILFPDNMAVCKAFQILMDKNEERIKKGEKPKFPIINLNRFEEKAPEPYFRRYTKDGDGVKEGDWIIANGDDEVLPNDPMRRKVFRSLWVTSICETVEGVDKPTENVVRKAARAWTNGLATEAGSGHMITPCAMQLKLEEKKSAAKEEKKEDTQMIGDDALIGEFEKPATKGRWD